jgi:hypothetical protein
MDIRRIRCARPSLLRRSRMAQRSTTCNVWPATASPALPSSTIGAAIIRRSQRVSCYLLMPKDCVSCLIKAAIQVQWGLRFMPNDASTDREPYETNTGLRKQPRALRTRASARGKHRTPPPMRPMEKESKSSTRDKAKEVDGLPEIFKNSHAVFRAG